MIPQPMASSKVSKFTFDVPPDLRAVMAQHPDVNWTAVFRAAIRSKARTVELAQLIAEEEADPRIQAVARQAKAGVGRRFRTAQDDAKGAA